MIIGGQIALGPTRLLRVCPEGTFIETSEDTSFFQISEMEYGRPIRIRSHDSQVDFPPAINLLLVSVDSTAKANFSVGLALDLQTSTSDSFEIGCRNPNLREIFEGWGDAPREALARLSPYEMIT